MKRKQITPLAGSTLEQTDRHSDAGFRRQLSPPSITHTPKTPFSTMEVAVRTASPPRSLASALEREIHQLDPEQPVMNVRSMDAITDSTLSPLPPRHAPGPHNRPAP